MYVDALSFLEDERDAWAPFEALLELSDDALERPTDPGGSAHGWSGRDLMAHLSSWQAICLAAATQLAVGQASEAIETAIWLTEVAPQMGKTGAQYLEYLANANNDANPGLSQSFGIMSIPTIAFFAPGETPVGVVGFRPMEQLEQAFKLEKYVQPAVAEPSPAAAEA